MRPPSPIAVLGAMLLLVGAPACKDEDPGGGTRGPKRALGAVAPEDEAPLPDEDEDPPTRPGPRDEARARSMGTQGAVDCPGGTEARGAEPPAALESYCLRRTEDGAVRHGPYRQWYADGTVRADGSFDDDQRDGLWTEYREDGTKKAETTFEDGARDGRWRTFYPDGSVEGEGTYREGRKSGRATFWYEDGTKKAEGTWENDLKVGPSTNWRADGTVESRGEYVAGNKHGKWVDVDAAGNEVESTWKDGEPVAP